MIRITGQPLRTLPNISVYSVKRRHAVMNNLNLINLLCHQKKKKIKIAWFVSVEEVDSWMCSSLGNRSIGSNFFVQNGRKNEEGTSSFAFIRNGMSDVGCKCSPQEYMCTEYSSITVHKTLWLLTLCSQSKCRFVVVQFISRWI